jgi:hypothetical protein
MEWPIPGVRDAIFRSAKGFFGRTEFAVWDMATQFFAGQLAGSGGNADDIYKELVANVIPNSHMVAAGVVAVNRAQEYGYTLLTTL